VCVVGVKGEPKNLVRPDLLCAKRRLLNLSSNYSRTVSQTMGVECRTYIRVPSETDVRENNKVLMELDECSVEITRLYKEICQLDNSKKCIEDRLVIALSSLAECRRRYLLLLSETSSNERIGENDSCSFVCGPHDTVATSNLI